MKSGQEGTAADEHQAGHASQQQQQPQQGQGEHAGQGADSVMKQLRVWEQNREAHSGVKRRQGGG